LNKIYSSTNLQSLAGKCADFLESSATSDPFKSHTILVPNLDSARWLRLRLAEHNDILANTDFLLPAEWQWKQIRKLYPKLPKILASDRGPLKWSVYRLLSNEKICQSFPVLHSYLASQKEISREYAVYQLSGILASIFDEYIIYRPVMMNRWERNSVAGGDEKWQSELWKKITEFWDTQIDLGYPQNRAKLFAEAEIALKKGGIQPEKSIAVFNTGLIPKSIVRLLKQSGSSADVRFFIMEPSLEIENPQNKIYRAFGEEAQNIAHVYHSVTENHKHLQPEIPETKTLLDDFKKSIMLDEELPDADLSNTPSVHVRSCHSPLREIEVLHEFLLELFELDSSLAPDDIAVVTPHPDRYKPYVDAVFNHNEEELPVIPYHIGEGQSGSGIEKALLRLLDLLDSRFSFEMVMDFFQSNTVRECYDISETQAARVRDWMQDNHVVWGLDGNHRAEWDQPRQSNQTWNSAFDRGWMGQWIGENDNDDILYYHQIESGEDQETWAKFSQFMRRLRDATISVKHSKTLKEWLNWLQDLQRLFFVKSDDITPLQRLIDSLLDTVLAAPESIKIPFRVFKSEVKQMIEKGGAAGAIFTRGVTFSSMVPLRSIPFKVIALIGLNDQEFPRKNVSPDFDLMARNPQPGERNRKLEDRNLFLESILAAEHVHYCSYVGQSPEDNEVIPPSTIVSEWVGFISECTGKKPNEIIKKEPLTGFSPSAFKTNPSYSDRYYKTLQKIRSNKSVSGMKCTTPIPLAAQNDEIKAQDFTRFFKNPLQYFIQEKFGGTIREENADKGEFSLDHLELHLLFQNVFGWVMSGTSKEVIHKRIRLSGIVPDGWPGDKLINEVEGASALSIKLLKKQNIKPGVHLKDIDIQTAGSRISGTIRSYTEERFVDVNLSKEAGRVVLQTWVNHILWNVGSGSGESYLITNIKKGEPSLFRFDAPLDPVKQLSDLIRIFNKGVTEPIKFFPDTLYEFVSAYSEEKGFENASKKFEGGQHFGERDHEAVKMLLGPDIPFDTSYMSSEYVEIMRELKNHMVEV
jgi:exodeoxyribonuclease V gamma subunit